MSNFVVNKNGLDQVTLEMMTTSRNEATVNLREALLDETLDYMFCVDHLNVPLNSVPLTNTIDTELFRVVRRNVGQSLNDETTTTADSIVLRGNLPQNVADQYVYVLGQKFYDVPTFVRSLNAWARGAERSFSVGGHTDFRELGGNSAAISAVASVVPPLRYLHPRTEADLDNNVTTVYDFIRFKLAVDGTLLMILSHDFTNNYILQFSRLGAEILGFGGLIQTVTRSVITDPIVLLGLPIVAAPADDYFLPVSTILVNGNPVVSHARADFVTGNIHTILAGGNISEVTIYGEHSLYMCLDQRIKVSVTSHLPMQNNMLVREGKQTVDKNIVEVYFDNKITTSVAFDETGVFKEQTVTNTIYAGQFPFIKKSDRSKQWHKLITSYDLRFFRFHVNVTYRNYDSVKDEWRLKTDRLTIDPKRYWDFSVRFISEV